MPDTAPHMHAGPMVIPIGGKTGELPELDAEIGASLRFHLGRQTSLLDQIAARLAESTNRPRYLSISGNATADASGWAAVQLGPASASQRWVIHNLVVGGILWTTAAAGSAVAIVSPSPPSPDQGVPLAQVRWASPSATPSLPAGETFSRGPVVVPPNQSLWLVVTGGTSGQAYSASCSFVAERADS